MKKRGEYSGTDSKRISRRQGSSGSLLGTLASGILGIFTNPLKAMARSSGVTSLLGKYNDYWFRRRNGLPYEQYSIDRLWEDASNMFYGRRNDNSWNRPVATDIDR